MLQIYKIVFSVLMLMIASCAAIDKQSGGEVGVDETGNYKFAAWRPVNDGELEAINILLDEADVLIEKNALNAAADKLERVLRIKPEYAPAWSRLSWLSLQMKVPKRAIEMAKRSNSLAYSNTELQALNWSFIRSASQTLNDAESYDQANQQIDSLKAF